MIATGTLAQAQVFVNGTSATTTNVTNTSVLLEFQQNVDKGIILPWTNGEVASPVNGTIILDANARKVKAFSNNAWIDLSRGAKTTNAIDLTLQQAPNVENASAKVVIGDVNGAPDGILVLNSTDRAMVLPKVESPHLFISNPAAGMMVYDPINNLLCLYNGTEWSFWKPAN